MEIISSTIHLGQMKLQSQELQEIICLPKTLVKYPPEKKSELEGTASSDVNGLYISIRLNACCHILQG